ncbi:PREDICTED: glutathione S-transferase 1-like isoform X2 [Priapulus caudatus]|uniref:Glutathione S-transferase 1-like isoform X2 n=1 Tax=Priapulus caudatus TaxID=37621 RepID=A0ABM1ELJ8_PRICU|nr:PREDICTED: glutathione S-transferase 1-like isoform X2 [Priapulus caudatus]
MPAYKLVYFNSRGLGEVARLLFAVSGTEYEDKRVTKEEWIEQKKETPFGQLPMLWVGDDIIFQSNAIYRYLARVFDLYGSSNMQAARIDSICECWRDVLQAVLNIIHEEDEERKGMLQKLAVTKIIPGFLALLQARLAKNNDGQWILLSRDKISLADIVSYHMLSSVVGRFPGVIDNFPTLQAYVDRIGEIPNIKAWVESRPETEF